MIRVTAFKWVPPFAQGLVRDLRVRWALEEVGQAYETRLIGPEEKATPEYLAEQPFGQVPVYEEDGLVLFESGAIVDHIATRSETLMPTEPGARSRVRAWMFAALNSVEPALQNLATIDLFCPDEEWAKLRRPAAEAGAQAKLDKLAGWFGGRDYLEEGRFTAGDLLMASVLRIPRNTVLVSGHPVLGPYVERCTARPAFQRALAAQMAPFEAAA
jgi:glutathione S-transferase